MKKGLILAMLILQIGVYAQNKEMVGKDILGAAPNEQFTSLRHSPITHQMFITSTKGQLIIVNDKNGREIITLEFRDGQGTVDIDQDGELGAYSTPETVFLFDLNSHKIVDEINIGTINEGGVKVWFTKSYVIISTFKSIYRYDCSTKETVLVASSYGVLDYDYKTDKILLGKWNGKLNFDRKVTDIYLTTTSLLVTGEIPAKPIFSLKESFQLYSYLMDSATNVLSYDGKGNFYITMPAMGVTQRINQNAVGMAKISDEHFAQVKYNALAITPENIRKYNLKLGDQPTELIIKKSSTSEIMEWVLVRNSIANNQIVYNESKNSIYFLTSGGNGNKLIAITK